MTKAPASIKIGGQFYSVEEAKELRNDKGEPLFGDCDEDILQIRYEKGMRRGKRQEIILHEVLHLVMSDLGLEKEAEEKLVTISSKSLLQILRDNPQLVSFLTT